MTYFLFVSGLQSIVNSIKNPPEGSLLYDQIQYFKKLIEADESIMEALTRHSPPVGTFGTKNAHEFDDIMSLAVSYFRGLLMANFKGEWDRSAFWFKKYIICYHCSIFFCN